MNNKKTKTSKTNKPIKNPPDPQQTVYHQLQQLYNNTFEAMLYLLT
jgi:hypothetical protein